MSRGAAISGPGTSVAFSSTATNLDPADVDAGEDVFVNDLVSGNVSLASVSEAGVNANGFSLVADMSSNGRRVSFHSSANNLDPADVDTAFDVYVKDVSTGEVWLASTSDAGVASNGSSLIATIAASGSRVAFQSNATNLDPADSDAGLDIYVKELSTGDLVLASSSDSGARGNAISIEPSLSSSGARVALSSQANNLDPGDTDTITDIYVKNVTTGDIRLVSTSDSGVKGNGSSSGAALSNDGKRVAFSSFSTNLDPADTDVLSDVYVGQPTICTVVGTALQDVLIGTAGNDVLCGRGGDDSLFGLEGDDVLAGESGADSFEGGPGVDALSYDSSPAGVEVSLTTGVGVGGDAGGDTVIDVEGIGGTPFPDDLSGDGGANELGGGPGDDVLTGGGGAATGDDLTSVEGVVGSAFADTLTGDAAANVFLGMGGGDDLDAGLGFDFVYYQFSTSGVTVDLTAQTASGGHATGDTLAGFESVLGSSFADVLSGNDDVNHLLGQGGDDTLAGFDGDDLLLGTTGIDTFSAGDGTDTCDFVAGEVHLSCEL